MTKTPKQILLEHLETMHAGGMRVRPIKTRATLADLQRWHRTQHGRFAANHYHEGVNLGPGDRPPGWRTGEDAVPIKRNTRKFTVADHVTVRGVPANEVNAFIQEGATAKVTPLPTCSCGESDVYDGYAECDAHPTEES